MYSQITEDQYLTARDAVEGRLHTGEDLETAVSKVVDEMSNTLHAMLLEDLYEEE